MVAISRPVSTASGARIAAVDALRGGAILAMVVYHFAWDLDAHGLTDADVTGDLGWVLFARLIAGTFLALVGVSLVLAARGGFRPAPYLRRLAIIVVAAGLVTAGTRWFMPDAFVFFGILHEIAVASVLGLPFVWAPGWVTLPAAAFFLAGRQLLAGPVLNSPALLWLGLTENPPPTVDYVPLFPWFGVVLLGIVAGRWIVRSGDLPLWEWRPAAWPSRLLVLAGRWSLAIYLVHQPILLGLILAIAPLIGPNEATLARRLDRQCQVSCAAVGQDQAACSAYCDCVAGRLGSEPGMLADVFANRLSAEQLSRWESFADECRAMALPPPPVEGHT